MRQQAVVDFAERAVGRSGRERTRRVAAAAAEQDTAGGGMVVVCDWVVWCVCQTALSVLAIGFLEPSNDGAVVRSSLHVPQPRKSLPALAGLGKLSMFPTHPSSGQAHSLAPLSPLPLVCWRVGEGSVSTFGERHGHALLFVSARAWPDAIPAVRHAAWCYPNPKNGHARKRRTAERRVLSIQHSHPKHTS